MTLHPDVIGIDIAKHRLDIYDALSAKHTSVPNQPEPLAELIHTWRERACLVVFEATGPYDALLRRALAGAGLRFVRVNPARARDFARATGQLAKTDAIDARVLAEMGRALALGAEPEPDPARERLAALHRRRDQLVETRAGERTRLAEARAAVSDSLESHIAWLDGEIARLEGEIETLIGETAELFEAARLLRSAPGVGPVTASTLLALMPELGQRSGKAVAALAGLAPLNRDSGQRRGARVIRGRRRRVRRALYMAALAAVRTHARFREFYGAVLARRAARKLALVAVARKLLVILNAVLKTKTLFQPA